MPNSPLPFRSRRTNSQCTDQVVGAILSGWRYDISGITPEMRTDYELHLAECSQCQRRQRLARTIDILLLSISTLSIAAFLLAAIVIRRIEIITHIETVRVHFRDTAIGISLQAVAFAGVFFSALLWLLVAIATPIPGLVGSLVQRRLPADLRDRITRRAA